MSRYYKISVFLILFPFAAFSSDSTKAVTRNIVVTYTCYLAKPPATSKKIDWWIPVPSSNDRQIVEITQADLASGRMTTETKYGNKMYYRQINSESIKSDTITVTLSYKVKIDEKLIQEARELAPLPKVKPNSNMQVYLSDNRLIPLKGPVADLTKQLQLPSEPIPAARQVYDYLINTMVYNYKAPGAGKGDVIWACTNKTGDCSDYHSIFIGVCRSSGIPADHIFGIPLKARQGTNVAKDWHCWASFWVNGPGWITIDASEAAKHPELRNYNFGTLSNTYLTLSHGRDVVLEPAQKGQSLNIFADPYVEVDGVPFEGVKWIVSYEEQN